MSDSNKVFRFNFKESNGVLSLESPSEFADESVVVQADPLALLSRIKKNGSPAQIVLTMCFIDTIVSKGHQTATLAKNELMSSDTVICGRVIKFIQLDEERWVMDPMAPTLFLQKIPGTIVECIRPEVVIGSNGTPCYMMLADQLNDLVLDLWDPLSVSKLPLIKESSVVPYLGMDGKESFISEVGTRFLADESAAVSTGPNARVSCHLCNLSIEHLMLRLHVASHLLENFPDEMPEEKSCGFCGRVNQCAVGMKQGSRKNIEVIESNCTFKPSTKVSVVSMKKHSKRYPATNHPLKCPSCIEIATWIWSYGMSDHYTKHHHDVPLPVELKDVAITQLEVLNVRNANRALKKNKTNK